MSYNANAELTAGVKNTLDTAYHSGISLGILKSCNIPIDPYVSGIAESLGKLVIENNYEPGLQEAASVMLAKGVRKGLEDQADPELTITCDEVVNALNKE